MPIRRSTSSMRLARLARSVFIDCGRSEWWFGFLGAALLVWFVVYMINLGILYRRSRELREQFRESYPNG